MQSAAILHGVLQTPNVPSASRQKRRKVTKRAATERQRLPAWPRGGVRPRLAQYARTRLWIARDMRAIFGCWHPCRFTPVPTPRGVVGAAMSDDDKTSV